MLRLAIVSAVIVLLTVAGCSNSFDKNNETESAHYTFTGVIKEIHDHGALVHAKNGSIKKGNVFVDLSVNNDETFQVGDKIKVEYNGIILKSNPAQITTLFVELVE